MNKTQGEPGSESAPLLNIANVLTVIRLLLVPVFVAVYWVATPGHAWAAWAVFAVAAVTDKLDGHLARSRGLVTNFGKLADSIADKALVASALIMLSWHGMLWWWVAIVMIGRELGITAMRMAMVKREVMAAGRGGKIKMVFQSFGIAGLLIPWRSFLPHILGEALVWASYALLAVALYFSIVSAIQYIRDAQRISRQAGSSPRTES
ncbi:MULTISPECIES: CDP-diacylglycerol--glycerol-3-phosphate 3-phosphatidyltransferase [unclassified Actinobaculum]|uniref:CDP-diacylglycerol--glycerol-3-phosphate 3-phosphatidyltransferase n=1 Tax=unclassified Actinobaculum TaxID=2609299 RepID=UPI000D52774B|nr:MULTISPECIES: CDP-diacylglycerol--glycerol-3-phosphate 3-phosphatidyltransferase [unclassified Actinobaculum]AWE42623.1 CDP-diacylglycerol--glycerol-3-phosphate 3-phosphatidyltransferase [Actinobaculum sp. 313]RTE47961.1 CDP-diacylglycerol--glycerol-3-phosphate 3-phosphatidyltransferase [Actinobaculum sp. 352]